MVLGVASVNVNKEKSEFSDYGKCIDVSAIGEKVISLSHPAFSKYGDYNIQDGTSFAAPQVAAALAVLKSRNPKLNNWEMYEAVIKSGENINNLKNNKGQVGTFLNLEAALSFKNFSAPIIQKVTYQKGVLKVQGQNFSRNLDLIIKYKRKNNKFRTVSFKIKSVFGNIFTKSVNFTDINNDFIEIFIKNSHNKSSNKKKVSLKNTFKEEENLSEEIVKIKNNNNDTEKSTTIDLQAKVQELMSIKNSFVRLKKIKTELKSIKDTKERIQLFRLIKENL